jgi:hypothetical protein
MVSSIVGQANVPVLGECVVGLRRDDAQQHRVVGLRRDDAQQHRVVGLRRDAAEQYRTVDATVT